MIHFYQEKICKMWHLLRCKYDMIDFFSGNEM